MSSTFRSQHARALWSLVAVGVKGNRHLQAPAGTPHANLLVDIVNKFGVETKAHGVSNGRFEI